MSEWKEVYSRPITEEEFRKTAWKCTYQEYLACYCPSCKNTDCIHRGAFRRVPVKDGGLGLCERLQSLSR